MSGQNHLTKFEKYLAPDFFVKKAVQYLIVYQKSVFRELIKTEYGVYNEVSLLDFQELRSLYVLDWLEHLSVHDGKSRNLIYEMGKYLYFKYGSFYYKDLDGNRLSRKASLTRAVYDEKYSDKRQIGNWVTAIKSALGLQHVFEDEQELTDLIVFYVEYKGKKGIEGLDLGGEYEIPDVIDNIGDSYNLLNIFYYVRKRTAAVFERKKGKKATNIFAECVTVESKICLMKKLLLAIYADSEFNMKVEALATEGTYEENNTVKVKPLSVIMQSNKGKVTSFDYEYNTNLGTDELMSVFLLHSSKKKFESEPILENELKYEEYEEIAEFIYDYFTIINRVMNKENTDKNQKYCIEFQRIDDYFYDGLIDGMVNTCAGKDISLAIRECIEQCLNERSKSIQDRKKNLFSSLIFDEIMKKCAPKDDFGKSYLQISLTRLMAEKLLWDTILLFDSEENQQEILKSIITNERVHGWFDDESILCVQPIEDLYDHGMHEKYAFALSRDQETNRFLNYKDILNSIMQNYIIVAGGKIVNKAPVVKECDNISVKVSELKDAELARLLSNSRIGNIKKHRQRVIRVGEWIIKNGYLDIDLERLADFKAIYDVLYYFEPADFLEKANIDIKVNTIKKEDVDPENFSRHVKMYLIMSVFIAKVYNNNPMSKDDTFIAICDNIMTLIDDIIETYSKIDYDHISMLFECKRESYHIAIKDMNNI